MPLDVLALGAVSLIVSLIASAIMIRIAPRFGLIDKPGGRKIHDNPKPLGGGVAIFVAFALPIIAALAIVNSTDRNPYYIGGMISGSKSEPPQTIVPDPVRGAYWDGL